MPEISNNYTIKTNANANFKKVSAQTTVPKETVVEYWRSEKRKNSGLIERFYNWIKNTAGLGVGSKKVELTVNKAKNNQISEQEAVKVIDKYSKSQETSAQLLGDGVSVVAAGGTFFALNKALKYAGAWIGVNKKIIDKLDEIAKKVRKELAADKTIKSKANRPPLSVILYEKTISTLKSNKKTAAICAGFAAIAGGVTKYFTLKFNRAGSDEFKVDKKKFGTNKNSAECRAEKKRLKRERKNTNRRNLISGIINGAMIPLFTIGGIIGAPIYIAANSLNRYIVSSKSKNKSIDDYCQNLVNDSVTAGVATAAFVLPVVKKANFTKVFNENISKVTKELSGKELQKPDFNEKTAYKELEELMLKSPSVKGIIDGSNYKSAKTKLQTMISDNQILKPVFENMPIVKYFLNSQKIMDKRITDLTKENIFAVKFKQISDDHSELAKALQEDCPPTRTVKEAQKLINKSFGKEYKIEKLLGVGTIAETYLAKSSDGKEVCIKMLKEGISKEKIIEDKEKFAKLIREMKDKSQDEKDYLLRNLDDLSDGILKEVDMQNEMEATHRLTKCTTAAHVVKPIQVKDNIYVMEKATGVSLKSFMELNRLLLIKESIETGKKKVNDFGEELGIKNGDKLIKRLSKIATYGIDRQIEKIKSRMPVFQDIRFDRRDTDYLLQEYQKVFIEQFHKVDKNGKTIHADVHPGNIFIDPTVLKTKKGKLFTLIDIGNTIDMNVEQSVHALNLANYVKNGDVKDIVDFVLQGAKLPQGMTEKEAEEKITAELKKLFFDKETKLNLLNGERVLAITDNIMQKYDIIPNSTQMNLTKSRTSAQNALTNLKFSLGWFDAIDAIGKETKTKMALSGAGKVANLIGREKAYDVMVSRQENANMKQLSIAQRMKQKNNPNMPSKNSEEYITYKLKQSIVNYDQFKKLLGE